MAQSSFSSSDLDLSKSLVSVPIKHPAYTHPSEYKKPGRTNSIPNAWQPSYIPHVCGQQYSDNKVRTNQSVREASKSLMNIDRQSSSNSSNSSDQGSPVNSRRRTLYWSTSHLYHSGRVSSPKVKHSHLFCQIPEMDNPRKRLSKASSIDSGNGSGSIPGSIRRKKPISPGRKRNNSTGSSSTTSSSSLGSLKEKLDKTEPVEVKRRSSLASLISRKSSISRHSSPSTSSKKISEDGDDDSPNLSTSSTDRSSLTASPLVRSSSLSPAKASALRDSLKAARKLLTPSSKANTEEPKMSFSKRSTTISEESVLVHNSSENEASSISHLRINQKQSNSGKRDDGAVTMYSTKNSVTSAHHKQGSISSPAKGLFGNSEKKQKEKDPNKTPTKTPTKNVLGKLFGKKSRGQSNISNASHNQEESIRQLQAEIPVEKNSLKIVNFESEPRKIVPKPRIVTLSSNNRRFCEMEVSEEAVALAKKLREEQRHREEVKGQKTGIVTVEVDSNGDKTNDFSSLPIPRPRRLSTTPKNNEDEEQTSTPKLDFDSDAKETLTDLTTVNYMDKNATEKANIEAKQQKESFRLIESEIQKESDTVESKASDAKPDESLLPELSSPLDPNSASPIINEEEREKETNNDLTKFTVEVENKVGSPCSSLEGQLTKVGISSNNDNADNPSNVEDSVEVETDNDDDNISIATTVTTTASEMDTSFMLSRSLALTEDEFSYTESFKQLKPFNYDHVDPIPEGKRERLYKVLVVGELGTGKTSIIKRYVHQFFSQHYRATIGVDFALKVLRWDPETVVRLQLWDIAGQERFGSMTRVYYKEAVGAFVVFDVTRAATLEAVPKWKADLDTKVVLPDGRPIPTVLLANKSDQPKEGIAANREKMNEFCQQQGFSAWFETSAKDNINIDESANFLVSKILDMDKWSQEPMASDPEKLDLTANGKHKAGGTSNCSC